MNLLQPITSLFTSAVSGVTKVFVEKQKRKTLAVSTKAKLNQSVQDGKLKVTLTDSEWEAIKAHGEQGTWKDEYVTILITFPYLMLILGSVSLIFFDDSRLTASAIGALDAMDKVGIDMGFLMEAVVFAAIGLKIWRK